MCLFSSVASEEKIHKVCNQIEKAQSKIIAMGEFNSMKTQLWAHIAMDQQYAMTNKFTIINTLEAFTRMGP